MSSTFPIQTTTYTGVCYCKATKYTATIRNLSGDICSCSFCRKTGFLYIHTPEDFKYERQGPLTTYRFATEELGYEVSGNELITADKDIYMIDDNPAWAQFCSLCGDQILVRSKGRKQFSLNVSQPIIHKQPACRRFP